MNLVGSNCISLARGEENSPTACWMGMMRMPSIGWPIVCGGFVVFGAARVAIMRTSSVVGLFCVGCVAAAVLMAVRLRAADDVAAVKLADCPMVVQTTLAEESHHAEIPLVDRVKTDNGVMTYEVEVKIHEKTYRIVVESDGTLWDKFLIADVDEEEIKFAQCPEQVQRTFAEESRDYKIKTVKKVSEDDRITYHTGVRFGKTEYMIIVGESGTLISKSIVEDDEK